MPYRWFPMLSEFWFWFFRSPKPWCQSYQKPENSEKHCKEHCFHRISGFNVLGHSRNITPQLPYIRRASPIHSRATDLRNHQVLIPLRAEGQWVILTAWPLPRRGGHSTEEIEMLVSTYLSYRSVNKLSFIYSTKNLYYIQGWKEGTPRVKLQLNFEFILGTLPSRLPVSLRAKAKKCDSPLNTGKMNFKISLSLS